MKAMPTTTAPPGDHDARNPPASAESIEREVAWYLAKDVTDKEDGARDAEGGLGEPDVLRHGEFGDANVASVDVVEEVRHG
nr:hypothetical protein [uncultured Arthrobacter sp.]